MAIRSNTIVFTFDPASPWITAHNIHELLHEEMRIQEQKVQMIQIGGIKRQVYVKLSDKYYMSIINSTRGSGAYAHHTGEISRVEMVLSLLLFVIHNRDYFMVNSEIHNISSRSKWNRTCINQYPTC